jgi:hypothetical protein
VFLDFVLPNFNGWWSTEFFQALQKESESPVCICIYTYETTDD